MTDDTVSSGIVVRPLSPEDLDAVVAIDRKQSGSARRAFYERRLRAALKNPKDFVYVAACEGGILVGFALARMVGGEFGRENAAAALDAIGVDPDREGRGIGQALMAGLDAVLRNKGVEELQTQAEWSDLGLLRFFAAAGFRHAPRTVLERAAVPFDEQ